jgi:excisionase family DNA binding protein
MSHEDSHDRDQRPDPAVVRADGSPRASVVSPADRRWWSAREAAEYVGAGPKEIYRAVRHGALKAVRLNRRGDIRTTREWIDQWMDEKRLDDPTVTSGVPQGVLDLDRHPE